MLQEMEQQLADMKNSTDQRITQAEKYIQETQEAWQDAVTRASQAEKQAREFEKAVSSLQEQLQVDQVHQQLWVPERSNMPTTQVTEDLGAKPINDESMDKECTRNDDTEMIEVNRIFNCHMYCIGSSVHRDHLAMISVLPFPNPYDFADLWGGKLPDRVLDQE